MNNPPTLPLPPPDDDPLETAEWLDAFDSVARIATGGVFVGAIR